VEASGAGLGSGLAGIGKGGDREAGVQVSSRTFWTAGHMCNSVTVSHHRLCPSSSTSAIVLVVVYIFN